MIKVLLIACLLIAPGAQDTEDIFQILKKEVKRIEEIVSYQVETIFKSRGKEEDIFSKKVEVSRGGWRTVLASTYGIGDGFLGEKMANGERLTLYEPSIAMRPSYRRTHGLKLGNWIFLRYKGKVVKARIDDSGPFVGSRMIDLGPAISKCLNFSGVHYIEWKPFIP